ncbi:hypothetical protein JNK62_03740 [bacterium]|nr:hypothetical protein [bacterium]
MTNPKVTPKDFFLWAGAMVSLYGSVVAFITLVFSYINYVFPDPLAYYTVDVFSGGMRFQMASLIVLVPVTLILMRLIRKDIAADSDKKDLWIRRWALFLTVFIAGAAIVIDLITLINYFLGGELTSRFLLKVAVLLLVAGGVFLHFFADLKGYWLKQPQRAQMVGWAAGLLVLVTILAGFFIMGTPAEARLYRFDSQKADDLLSIQWQVVNFWQQKETLPASLEELNDPIGGWRNPVDPQSGESYRYERTSNSSFKLCATFNRSSDENKRQSSIARPAAMYGAPMPDENWDHGEGEHCFDRTIDPERYPPYNKPVR